MKKRLILCCDGTWQDLETEFPTNIVRIAQAVKPTDSNGMTQMVFYDEGVGTFNFLDKAAGGAFGWGLDRNIAQAYRFLVLNWEPGDEIHLFGFSRGAYTVRSLGGLIRKCGILDGQYLRKIPNALNIYRDREAPVDGPEAVNFRTNYGKEAQITSLVCFDTVGSLGLPDQIPFLPFDNWANAKYQFHDIQISKLIDHAFHAVAIDEPRKVFAPTLMEKSPNHRQQKVRQTWFAGDHGCVGGGGKKKVPLSDIALDWVFEEYQKAKLKLEVNRTILFPEERQDPLADFEVDRGILGMLGGFERKIVGGKSALHPSVKTRWQNASPKYRPGNLRRLLG